jgi:hypothetical protein
MHRDGPERALAAHVIVMAASMRVHASAIDEVMDVAGPFGDAADRQELRRCLAVIEAADCGPVPRI